MSLIFAKPSSKSNTPFARARIQVPPSCCGCDWRLAVSSSSQRVDQPFRSPISIVPIPTLASAAFIYRAGALHQRRAQRSGEGTIRGDLDMLFLKLATLVSLALLGLASHHPFDLHPRRHNSDVATRDPGTVDLHRRFSGTRWTFYNAQTGRPGACGQYIRNSDWAVALNTAQFGHGYPGPNCFRTITLSYGGRTAVVRIMDKCPGCPWGGLDLTPALFAHFGSRDRGVLYGEWEFGRVAPAPPPAPPHPHHTTTWRPAPPPTSTWRTPTTSPEPATANTPLNPAPTTTSNHALPSTVQWEPVVTPAVITEGNTTATPVAAATSNGTNSSSPTALSPTSDSVSVQQGNNIANSSIATPSASSTPENFVGAVLIGASRIGGGIGSLNAAFIALGGLVVGGGQTA